MMPIPTIVAKELRSYFVSPIVYVVGSVFLLIFGVLSYLMVINAGAQAIRLMQLQGVAPQLNLNDLVFRPAFHSTAIVAMLALPLLTMRLFAEERKLKTFELLMTAPIHTHEIVAGKFIGVLLIYLGLLVMTLIVPLVLMVFSHFDWAPVLTGYLGLILLGALFLATGVLASAMTENQIIAAFIGFGVSILFWLMGGLGAVLGDTALGRAISYCSYLEHYDRLIRGLVETKDLLYYASGILLMLFLANRVVESQRWK